MRHTVMDDPHASNLLDVALAAAHTAGHHALDHAHRRSDTVRVDAHDVKLVLDAECQAQATRVIHHRRPDDVIIGEEDAPTMPGDLTQLSFMPSESDGPVHWIVDPIDGTVNFAHGLPLWCCSVAALVGRTVVAAAVYAPELDASYAAASGQPATRNGDPIRVSSVTELSRAIVATGLDKAVQPGGQPLGILTKIASATQKARVMGSAALDICRVADGAVDGYFEAGVYVWDVAAAGLIVQQSGGSAEVTGTIAGDGRLTFMASNGLIHEPLRHVIVSP